eukprot:510217_1
MKKQVRLMCGGCLMTADDHTIAHDHCLPQDDKTLLTRAKQFQDELRGQKQLNAFCSSDIDSSEAELNAFLKDEDPEPKCSNEWVWRVKEGTQGRIGVTNQRALIVYLVYR